MPRPAPLPVLGTLALSLALGACGPAPAPASGSLAAAVATDDEPSRATAPLATPDPAALEAVRTEIAHEQAMAKDQQPVLDAYNAQLARAQAAYAEALAKEQAAPSEATKKATVEAQLAIDNITTGLAEPAKKALAAQTAAAVNAQFLAAAMGTAASPAPGASEAPKTAAALQLQLTKERTDLLALQADLTEANRLPQLQLNLRFDVNNYAQHPNAIETGLMHMGMIGRELNDVVQALAHLRDNPAKIAALKAKIAADDATLKAMPAATATPPAAATPATPRVTAAPGMACANSDQVVRDRCMINANYHFDQGLGGWVLGTPASPVGSPVVFPSVAPPSPSPSPSPTPLGLVKVDGGGVGLTGAASDAAMPGLTL